MTTAYLLDWLSLVARWFHVIAGIAWMGASFYFIWLDNSLREPPQWKKEKGIKGDLWSIHGGGIYEVAKYRLAPEKMPETLHWFKWEAYSTWLSGVFLLAVVYYSQAGSYMMVQGGLIKEPSVAVLTGIGFLISSVVIYEVLMKTALAKAPLIFAAVIVAYFFGLSCIAWELFAPRAALIHVGASVGSIMAANVFLGIIPSQRDFVRAVEQGQEPDAAKASFAKLRSTHNNYFSLPIILMMVGNHYPVLYSRDDGWLIVMILALIAAFARHFFNLRHRGIVRPSILVLAALATIGLAIIIAPKKLELSSVTVVQQNSGAVNRAAAEVVPDKVVENILHSHCSSCHAKEPSHPAFAAPPGAIVLETLMDLSLAAPRVYRTTVASKYMPLGNVSGMTEEERRQLGAWIIRGRPGPEQPGNP